MNNNLINDIKNYVDSTTNKKLIYTNKLITLKTKLSTSDSFKKTKLYEDIVSETSFLDKNTPLYLRIKTILLGISDIPLCLICKKPCKLNYSSTFTSPLFYKTCGNKACAATIASNNRKEISDKNRNFLIKQQKELQQNRNNIKLEFIKNFKETHNYSIDEIKSFCNDRLIKRYSSNSHNGQLVVMNDYYTNSKYLSDILTLTKFIDIKYPIKWIERFTCIINNITKYPVCKYCNKVITNFTTYGNKYPESCPECSSNKSREHMNLLPIEDTKKLIDTSKYEIINFPTSDFINNKLIVKCKKCGHISSRFIGNGISQLLDKIKLCDICDKYVSKEEKELSYFINSELNEQIIKNTRSVIAPYELDIYIKDKNIAFEFDGLYWHNDISKDRYYHLNKTQKCEDKSIHLIHIFENEWCYKKDIVKSRIKSLLGKYDNIVYARKCIVKEITNKKSAEFQQNNHLQGYVNSKVNLGLYYNNELISLMTFSKPRFDKKHEWELLRFCNKLNYHIPGAASKLLSFFEKKYNPKNLISYADRRWTCNNNNTVYDKLGFKLDHISIPNYWYFKSTKCLESRVKYQKHKQEKLLKYYDKSKSEYENMKDNGFNRIFDCGNLVFVKTYPGVSK